MFRVKTLEKENRYKVIKNHQKFLTQVITADLIGYLACMPKYVCAHVCVHPGMSMCMYLCASMWAYIDTDYAIIYTHTHIFVLLCNTMLPAFSHY